MSDASKRLLDSFKVPTCPNCGKPIPTSNVKTIQRSLVESNPLVPISLIALENNIKYFYCPHYCVLTMDQITIVKEFFNE